MGVEGLSGNQGSKIGQRRGEKLTKTRDVMKNLYGNLPFCKYSKKKTPYLGG